MKRSIQHHQAVLDIMLRNLEEDTRRLAKANDAVAYQTKLCRAYGHKIQAAVTKGKDGFDPDKFLKARKL